MTNPAPKKSFRDAARDLRDAWNAPTTPLAPEPAGDDAEVPAVVAPAKRKWTALPSTQFKGKDGTLQLYPDGIDHLAGLKKATIPLNTIQSITIEDGADLEARITATRLVLIGVFALAFRKRKGGEKYLTIESDDAFTVVQVDRKSIPQAQKFAAAARTAMKSA